TGSSFATTIGVLMTDAVLTKPQAGKLAQIGHDGMARAIRPLHSMLDGDSVFAMASQQRPLPGDRLTALLTFNDLLESAADVFTDACLNAVVRATSRSEWSSWADLAPSTLQRPDEESK
ncbi:MAG: P1 family peptidase, partial [Propionibacteriales bacterium]|nr:P1 family peptidase [Propionibacteriales bacterium]